MAAVDYFLKIDGIQGESRDDRHKDEIDIESFSWGETQSGTFAVGGGGGAGKVSMQDFHFTMPVNKASPALFLACAQGDHIKNAILTCRKAGRDQREFMKVTMNDVWSLRFKSVEQEVLFRPIRSHSTSRRLRLNIKSRMPPVNSWPQSRSGLI